MLKDFIFVESNDSDGEICPDKYELILRKKFLNDDIEYLVIGYIEYNVKEKRWDFNGCGLNYQKYYEEGLNKLVLKYVELLDLQMEYHNKEIDKFYNCY